MKLFDEFERTDSTFQGRTEGDFDFLDRTADPRFEEIRARIESWFARLPGEGKDDIEKKVHLRERFRGDDGPHSGALLELITHEFLSVIGNNVLVDPDLNGLTPDFMATIGGIRVLMECTVVQLSKVQLGADKRESVIKKAIDSIDSGRFKLWTDFSIHGPKSPPTKPLRKCIEKWLGTLDPDQELLRLERTAGLKKFEWDCEGWRIEAKAIPLSHCTEKRKEQRAIGGETRISDVTADCQIQTSLEKKSEKYRASSLPYIVVLSHRLDQINVALSRISDNSLVDALYGRETWRIPLSPKSSDACAQKQRTFNGFFGSPKKPRNRRVSAVLCKRELTLTHPSSNRNPDNLPMWVVYLHPWAERPLPGKLFPFAASLDVTRTPQISHPTCTLKELLNLPTLAKDEYTIEGGLWQELVG